MIGDPEILIAALARRLRHHLQRIDAVREIGMRMQDAAQVAVRDEARQRALIARVDLVAAFAQLRRDERQAERGVDLFLASGGDGLRPRRRPSPIEVRPLRGQARSASRWAREPVASSRVTP